MRYTMLVQRQLVGVCLYVFVADTILNDVRDVVVRECKVGMHGFTGMFGKSYYHILRA